MAENSGTTLDELLASRKINQDQKAQAQKKPSLQASLAQLEEQIAQYKQFDEDYQKRLSAEKSALETSHKDELQKAKEAAVAETIAEGKKEAKDNLLALSKFLRAAAAKRQSGDETSAENRAFEGALLLVYGGEVGAVVAMESLIAGADEKVPTVDQTPSDFTCKPNLLEPHVPYRDSTDYGEQTSKFVTSPLNMLLTPQRKHGQKKSLNPSLRRHQPRILPRLPSALILLLPMLALQKWMINQRLCRTGFPSMPIP